VTTVFIISAPSGSGKSTLVEKVRTIVQDLDFSISYTTRPPRGKEQDGREYFFVSRGEFEKMIGRDEFLEHAEVFGNYYGTAKRFLLEAAASQHDLLLDIDVQGAEQIKCKLPEAVSIFIFPPKRSVLESRLRNRGEDAEKVIQTRLVTASGELKNYDKYDYILINDRLDESVEALTAILLTERAKRSGTAESGQDARMKAQAEACRLEKVRDRLKPILDSFEITPSRK
jgi:guanylate kinase